MCKKKQINVGNQTEKNLYYKIWKKKILYNYFELLEIVLVFLLSVYCLLKQVKHEFNEFHAYLITCSVIHDLKYAQKIVVNVN